jgi:site-specific DNA-methyltransferase (adenine-specific)
MGVNVSENTNLFNEQSNDPANKDSHIAIVNRSPLSLVFNEDCVAGMKRFSDGHFDLAIVDPPYGIGRDGLNNSRKGNGKGRKGFDFKGWDSDIPSEEYFSELFRVSKNQIIFGANYFTKHLPSSMGWIVWDKGQRIMQSDAELIFTSFDIALRICIFGRHLLATQNTFHPTQKPIELYEWLLTNYAVKGNLILDTHLGSGSSRIACEKAGLDFVGFELDTDYFLAQEKRFKDHLVQGRLFNADFC